ncbi:uncharacterized protein LOC129757531 [Uranotaenia lowii]|uniref:uncharacterized protein LOC129757531 n=1 Tax=Uranotaenia lowii TaxID=190385 RepID=UPI0024790B72|nr:uncharacterized protein LOC129757531 [Uranotaenia lowii]
MQTRWIVCALGILAVLSQISVADPIDTAPAKSVPEKQPVVAADEDQLRSSIPGVPADSDDFFKQEKKYIVKCESGEKQEFFGAWRNCLDLKYQFATVENPKDRRLLYKALEEVDEYVHISGTDLGKEGLPVWFTNGRVVDMNRIGCDPDDNPPRGGNDNNEWRDCLSVKRDDELNNFVCKWESCQKSRCYVCQDYLT